MTAVVVNVTAVNPTAHSFVTVYPAGTPRPNASNLNFNAGQVFPNLVVVWVGADGKVDFYNNAGSVNLIADLSGYFLTTPWGTATELPGSAALFNHPSAKLLSVSCASAGNCAAGGAYTDSPYDGQAFVADEVNGTWNDATVVPGTSGTTGLNTGGNAAVTSVSCPSAGNCTAGGYYGDSSGHAFVADEVDDTWANAKEVPGTAAAGTGAKVYSVSCASAGNCAAGGYYSSGHPQAFVADEVNGTWNDATEVPGTAALNTGVYATVTSVSCASAGNCAAGGYYDGYGGQQAFVASEVNGTWNDATEVPGTAALSTGWFAVTSVSCASAGNCAVGGYYFDSSSNGQAFVASEVNGVWGNATEVPGTATLNTGGFAEVTSVSCPSAANCAAGGFYTESSGYGKAFVVSESP